MLADAIAPAANPTEEFEMQNQDHRPPALDPYTEQAWGSYQIWFDAEEPSLSVGAPLPRVGAFFLRLQGPYVVTRMHTPTPGRVRCLIVDTVGGPLSAQARRNPLPDWDEFQELVRDLPGMHVIIRPVLSDPASWNVSINDGRYYRNAQASNQENSHAQRSH